MIKKNNPCRKHFFECVDFNECPKCGWSGRFEEKKFKMKKEEELFNEIEKIMTDILNGKIKIPKTKENNEGFYIDAVELMKVIKQRIFKDEDKPNTKHS